ncbi:MAG: hypothetical protein U0232_17765 [Thermomicrobiales bacterium]
MLELMRLVWLVAFMVGIGALLLLCDVMVPGLLERTRRTLAAMPGRSFAVGLVNGAFFGVERGAARTGRGDRAAGDYSGDAAAGGVALGLWRGRRESWGAGAGRGRRIRCGSLWLGRVFWWWRRRCRSWGGLWCCHSRGWRGWGRC